MRTLPLVALVIAALLAQAAAFAAEEPGAVSARAFTIHHRPLADAAELVGPLLSERGKLTLQPRLKVLVVEDAPEVLDRVGDLLDSFDIPPRSVEITATLVLASDTRATEAGRTFESLGVSEEVRGIFKKLEKLTTYGVYQPLGSSSVTGVEGGTTVIALSEDYRVVLEIANVDEAADKIYLDRVALQRIIRTADGVRYSDVYAASMVMKDGRLNNVGATSGPDSKRALFLTLRATAR